MIGVVGSVASQIWQAVREARSGDAGSGAAAGSAQPSGSAAAASPPGSSIGSDASKLISDVQSLLLNLQSGDASAGSTGGSGVSGGSATVASTDPAAAVQADLATLSQDQAQVQGGEHARHHHHHHGGGGGGGAATGGNDAGTGAAPASGTGTASDYDAGLAGAVAKAIKAYEGTASAA